MSELGEMFRDMKEFKREKKESNLAWSVSHPKELGIDFEDKGYHLVVRHNDHVVDFWPSTGKYSFRIKGSNKRKYSRGVRKMIKELER